MIIKNGKKVGFVFHNDRSVRYKYNKNRLFFIRGWKVSTGSVVVKCISRNNVNDGMRLEAIGDPIESYTILGNTEQQSSSVTQPLLENPIHSVGNRSKTIVNYHIALPMSEPLTILDTKCSGITVRVKLKNVVCKGGYKNPDTGYTLNYDADLRDDHILKMWKTGNPSGIACGLCSAYPQSRYYFPDMVGKKFNLDYSVYVDDTIRKIEFMLGSDIISNNTGTCDIEISYGARELFYRNSDKFYIPIRTEYVNKVKPKILSETTTVLSDNYSCITKLNGDIVIHRTADGDESEPLYFSVPTLYGITGNKIKLSRGNYFIYALPCEPSVRNKVTNYLHKMHIFDKNSEEICTFLPTPSNPSYMLQLEDKDEIDIVIEINTNYKNTGDITIRPIVMQFNPNPSMLDKYKMVAPIFNDIELDEPLAKINDYVDSFSSANGEAIYKIAKIEYVVDGDGELKRKENGVLYDCFEDDISEYITPSNVAIAGFTDTTHDKYIDTENTVLCNYFKISNNIEIEDNRISGEDAQIVQLSGIGNRISLNQPVGVNNVETPILNYSIFGLTTGFNGVGDKTYNILPSSSIIDSEQATPNHGLIMTCDGFGNYHISGTLEGTESILSVTLTDSVTIPDSIQNDGHGCMYTFNDIPKRSNYEAKFSLDDSVGYYSMEKSTTDIWDAYESDESGIGGKTVNTLKLKVSGTEGDVVDFNFQIMITNVSTDVYDPEAPKQSYVTRQYKPFGFDIPIYYNVTDTTYHVYTHYELFDDYYIDYSYGAVMETVDGQAVYIDNAIAPQINVTKSSPNYLEVMTENPTSAISVRLLSSVFEYLSVSAQSNDQQELAIYSQYFAGKTKDDFIAWAKDCYMKQRPLTIYLIRKNNYTVQATSPKLETLFSMNNKYHAEVSRYRFDVSVNPTVNMTYNSFLERK